MIQYRIIERFIATLRNIVNGNVWRNYCTSCCNVSIFLVVYYFMSVSWLSHWFLTTSSGKTQFWNYGTTACTGFFLGRFFGSHNLNFYYVVMMCNVVRYLFLWYSLYLSTLCLTSSISTTNVWLNWVLLGHFGFWQRQRTIILWYANLLLKVRVFTNLQTVGALQKANLVPI